MHELNVYIVCCVLKFNGVMKNKSYNNNLLLDLGHYNNNILLWHSYTCSYMEILALYIIWNSYAVRPLYSCGFYN